MEPHTTSFLEISIKADILLRVATHCIVGSLWFSIQIRSNITGMKNKIGTISTSLLAEMRNKKH
jgi:hypothetical protein